MQYKLSLCLWLLVLTGSTAHAFADQSRDTHDACVAEVQTLVRFGEQVIEPFLPTQEGQQSFAAVQELISFTRGSVAELRKECASYGDLDRMMLMLALIWETYRRMALGDLQEFSTLVYIDRAVQEM